MITAIILLDLMIGTVLTGVMGWRNLLDSILTTALAIGAIAIIEGLCVALTAVMGNFFTVTEVEGSVDITPGIVVVAIMTLVIIVQVVLKLSDTFLEPSSAPIEEDEEGEESIVPMGRQVPDTFPEIWTYY